MATNQTTTVIGRIHSNPAKNVVTSKKEKIYGFTYPFGSRTGRGFFNKDEGNSLIINNIQQLLRTEKGERVMLPNYGAGMKKYLFEPMDEIAFENIKHDIVHAINTYEPRVEILKLRVFEMEDNRLVVKLTLKIIESVGNVFDVEVKL